MFVYFGCIVDENTGRLQPDNFDKTSANSFLKVIGSCCYL